MWMMEGNERSLLPNIYLDLLLFSSASKTYVTRTTTVFSVGPRNCLVGTSPHHFLSPTTYALLCKYHRFVEPQFWFVFESFQKKVPICSNILKISFSSIGKFENAMKIPYHLQLNYINNSLLLISVCIALFPLVNDAVHDRLIYIRLSHSLASF